jgi:hypothetical protein
MIDTGCAITTISGYDGTRIGIDYEALRPRLPGLASEVADVAGRSVRSYRLNNVVVALRRTSGKLVFQFLRHVDVLEPEQGMTDGDHIPSLLGSPRGSGHKNRGNQPNNHGHTERESPTAES